MSDAVDTGFPRSARLLKANQFQAVFKHSFRVGDASFTLLISQHQGRRPRLGFAIAKKQIKRAVDRNRLKRIIRQSFRISQQHLPERDIIVMVRQPILKLKHPELFGQLEKHWQNVIRKCTKS